VRSTGVIEVPPPSRTVCWRKSTFSGASGCVEIAETAEHVWVRDTKDRSGPVLGFTRHEWSAFLAGAVAGEFGTAD
jgi:hypothetical protein